MTPTARCHLTLRAARVIISSRGMAEATDLADRYDPPTPRSFIWELSATEPPERVAGLLDLNFDHRTERSELGLVGQYARQDTINAQFGEAAFTGPTGPIPTPTPAAWVRRDHPDPFSLDPSFSYQLTKLTGRGSS